MTDTPQPGAPLHGPGGLLATPGLGARRKGRKWGQRLKATQIAGNLYRGNDGKFQAGGGGPVASTRVAPSTPQARPTKQTLPKVRPLAKPTGGKGGKKGAAPKGKDPATLARQAQRDQEHAQDRATRQADRQARLDRQAQRDEERAADRAQRQADRQARLAKQQQKKGGGGGKAKPSDADKQQAAAQKKAETAAATGKQVGLTADAVDDLRRARDEGGVANPALQQLGLVGDDGLATDAGRRAMSALELGKPGGYHAAVQDAQARQEREQAAAQRKQDAAATRTAAQAERDAKQQRQLDTLARRARAGNKLTQAQRDTLTSAGLAEDDGTMWRLKAFTVFKDASGRHRWLARTTTSYRDRDGEIIATDALDRDSQRMMATKQFGPLRWWHLGSPDPLDPAAPWGPGVDIGDCDYSVVIGRTRIESGTFRDPVVAQRMAHVADRLEMSPGFFHPPDQPAADGVFSEIRTFERSPVPTRYGRASNLFTGFTVKEFRMNALEMERRFKALISELGLDAAQAQGLADGLVQTEKAAAAQGVAFKSQDAAPEEITINGVVYTVKAAPPPPAEADPAAPPVAEAKAPDVIDDGDAPADEPLEETNYVGDMSVTDFEAMLGGMLQTALGPLVKSLDITGTMANHMNELKSMMGGYATKDDSRAQELATLKAQQAELASKIAAIEGAQPAVVLPDDVAAALKSAGPETPPEADPNAVVVPNDPNRPLAALGARTFPELYQGYGPNGWVKTTP